jgi:predicted nucleic acid-binding protein
MALVLIDTNLLIYLYDQNEPVKQRQARFVLDRLQIMGAGRVSIQCLSEFANIAPKKLPTFITSADVSEHVRMFAHIWPVCFVTPAIVAEAARAVYDYKLPFYDAQIWACAKFNEIPLIFSEDFQDGQTLEGVRFVNPFAENFQVEKWL